MIREEAAKQKNQLEKVNVLIERAPVCKSIFIRGIPENTPQEEVEDYFDKFGIVEKFVTNVEEVKAQRMKEKRAIVYFKTDKRTWLENFNRNGCNTVYRKGNIMLFKVVLWTVTTFTFFYAKTETSEV